MVSVTAEQHIACTPEAFVAFVMDIERYAEVDDKISPILWSRRQGDVVEFACRPTLAGLPQPKVIQLVRLTEPGRRIDIRLSPLPRNRMAHSMAHFQASFECVPAPGGTRVIRALEFTFTPWVRWLLEPWFGRRLPDEVRRELHLAKEHLERPRQAAEDG